VSQNRFGATIKAIEYHLPKTCEDNDMLSVENPEWRMDDIFSKTGIKKRWISGENETSVDLAYFAAKKVIDKFDAEKIDTLLYVTQSPDYFLPSSSCILQDRLSLPSNIKSFDINLGCSGYMYGLSIASAYIESGLSENVLLVCSDTYTKYILPNDRTNRPIFSDAASATLVSKSVPKNIGYFSFGTNGSGFDKLIVKEGAAKSNFMVSGVQPSLYMNGAEVFMFTMSTIPDNVEKVLIESSNTINNIDYFFFHQASKIVLENLSRKLELPREKVYSCMEEIGNTVSSSIPIALKIASSSKVLSKGSKLLLSGFGVGLSWGSCILEWDELL
jgi:3-oxoacyl-[acyl-carrier-protein] synthase III